MNKNRLEEWAGSVSTVLFLCAGLVFAYQGYLWLKIGTWVPMPLSTFLTLLGMDLPPIIVSIHWLGIRQIVEWMIDVSLAAWFITLAVAVVYAVNTLTSPKGGS